jgi:hypothetical protein
MEGGICVRIRKMETSSCIAAAAATLAKASKAQSLRMSVMVVVVDFLLFPKVVRRPITDGMREREREDLYELENTDNHDSTKSIIKP